MNNKATLKGNTQTSRREMICIRYLGALWLLITLACSKLPGELPKDHTADENRQSIERLDRELDSEKSRGDLDQESSKVQKFQLANQKEAIENHEERHDATELKDAKQDSNIGDLETWRQRIKDNAVNGEIYAKIKEEFFTPHENCLNNPKADTCTTIEQIKDCFKKPENLDDFCQNIADIFDRLAKNEKDIQQNRTDIEKYYCAILAKPRSSNCRDSRSIAEILQDPIDPKEVVGRDHPWANEKVVVGDIVGNINNQLKGCSVGFQEKLSEADAGGYFWLDLGIKADDAEDEDDILSYKALEVNIYHKGWATAQVFLEKFAQSSSFNQSCEIIEAPTNEEFLKFALGEMKQHNNDMSQCLEQPQSCASPAGLDVKEGENVSIYIPGPKAEDESEDEVEDEVEDESEGTGSRSRDSGAAGLADLSQDAIVAMTLGNPDVAGVEVYKNLVIDSSHGFYASLETSLRGYIFDNFQEVFDVLVEVDRPVGSALNVVLEASALGVQLASINKTYQAETVLLEKKVYDSFEATIFQANFFVGVVPVVVMGSVSGSMGWEEMKLNSVHLEGGAFGHDLTFRATGNVSVDIFSGVGLGKGLRGGVSGKVDLYDGKFTLAAKANEATGKVCAESKAQGEMLRGSIWAILENPAAAPGSDAVGMAQDICNQGIAAGQKFFKNLEEFGKAVFDLEKYGEALHPLGKIAQAELFRNQAKMLMVGRIENNIPTPCDKPPGGTLGQIIQGGCDLASSNELSIGDISISVGDITNPKKVIDSWSDKADDLFGGRLPKLPSGGPKLPLGSLGLTSHRGSEIVGKFCEEAGNQIKKGLEFTNFKKELFAKAGKKLHENVLFSNCQNIGF